MFNVNSLHPFLKSVISPDLVCSPSPATFAETLAIIAGLIHPELNPEKMQ